MARKKLRISVAQILLRWVLGAGRGFQIGEFPTSCYFFALLFASLSVARFFVCRVCTRRRAILFLQIGRGFRLLQISPSDFACEFPPISFTLFALPFHTPHERSHTNYHGNAGYDPANFCPKARAFACYNFVAFHGSNQSYAQARDGHPRGLPHHQYQLADVWRRRDDERWRDL